MKNTPQAQKYVLREITGFPSTTCIKTMRACYLSEPLMIDAEYIKFYTETHKRTDGLNVLERRAECHADALENITPVIRDAELFVGSKTRYLRGAIPYCNYACWFILKEFRREEHEAQDRVTDLGTGGGIEKARKMAENGVP